MVCPLFVNLLFIPVVKYFLHIIICIQKIQNTVDVGQILLRCQLHSGPPNGRPATPVCTAQMASCVRSRRSSLLRMLLR